MTKPKILLYLHHVELGQRYPISEDVVIGRKGGQLLFPKDERLSNEHCRIFRDSDNALMIRDLSSTHGTVVDGRLLSPEKSYPIREGTLIAVGGQVFKCVEPSNRPMKKPARKKPKHGNAGTGIVPLVILRLLFAGAAVALCFYPPTRRYAKQALSPLINLARNYYKANKEMPPAPPITSPFEMVFKEIETAYTQYREIGKAVQSGQLNNKAMAVELRNSLIPKFQAAQAKLVILKPSNERERLRIDANFKLVTSVLNQITAMASFAETKNPKYSQLIEKFTPEVETASEEARKVNNPRVPASGGL